MKICITEPTNKENTKSVGCWFIESTLQKNGYDCEYVVFDDGIDFEKYDLYLFSVLSVRDYFHLAKIAHKRKDKIWIGGGHVTNNPYVLLHFFDLICVGEGEEWILKCMKAFEKYKDDKEAFLSLMSKIQGSLTMQNRHLPIQKLFIKDISINDPYLNKSSQKGHGDSWYIETARGCKSKCAYCELGWSNPYRENSEEKVSEGIEQIKLSDNKNVKVFAPDDFSVTPYERYIEKIIEEGLITKFGSMRLDRVMKIQKRHKKNFLYRLGIDGLSERVRDIVGKRIFDDDIIKIVSIMTEDGFVNFKFFMIFSYEFEQEQDFYQFERMIEKLKQAVTKTGKKIILRLKFTPFVPQDLTPMENYAPNYNTRMRDLIRAFFDKNKESQRRSSVIVINDGLQDEKGYYGQAFLHRAGYEQVDIEMLQNQAKFNMIAPDLAKLPKAENLVQTHLPKKIRDTFFDKMQQKINGKNSEELTNWHSELKQANFKDENNV
jgi:radical SAM superfamily enzyme YgiQ (UPF0313 family)